MLTCPECKTRNFNGAQVCIKCGASLKNITPGVEQGDSTRTLSSEVRYVQSDFRDALGIDSESSQADGKRSFETAKFIEMLTHYLNVIRMLKFCKNRLSFR
jgi:hypothetical protein